MIRLVVLALEALVFGLTGVVMTARLMTYRDRSAARRGPFRPMCAMSISYLGLVATTAAGILTRVGDPLNWRTYSIGVFTLIGIFALVRMVREQFSPR